MALLNMRAEINIMIKKVMEDVNLTMKCSFQLELVSHTSHSLPFFGLYKDIIVVVGSIKTRYPIFVIKYRDYNFELE